MNYTSEQRQQIISALSVAIKEMPTNSDSDRMVKQIIAPALIELAQDCEELSNLVSAQKHTIEVLERVLQK